MNSWLELEQRFRALAPALRHYRIDAQWGAAGDYWRIAGSASNPATTEYEILSTLAGQMLQRVLSQKVESEKALISIEDPKIRWYTALKLLSPSFGNNLYAEQVKEDGSSGGFIFTGTISSIGEASANLCLAFHASHPIVERTSRWRWLHDNYIKAIIIGCILALVGMLRSC